MLNYKSYELTPNTWKGENGCHNRKQTERSYQIFIHIAGCWRSTFFALFYFPLPVVPVISKISLCGRTFWHGTRAPTTRQLQLTSDRPSERQTTHPRSQGFLLPALRSARERDPGKRWSRGSRTKLFLREESFVSHFFVSFIRHVVIATAR